jgi:hypothetical protein
MKSSSSDMAERSSCPKVGWGVSDTRLCARSFETRANLLIKKKKKKESFSFVLAGLLDASPVSVVYPRHILSWFV